MLLSRLINGFSERALGKTPDGSPCTLEIEVEVMVPRWDAPRIMLHIESEQARPPKLGGTWWLDISEANDLAFWLRSGAERARAGQLGMVDGYNSPTPAWPSWLTVSVVADRPPELAVQVRFHNHHLNDADSADVIRFSAPEADALASFLARSVAWAEQHPPVVI
jgi:hypothetical protein